MDRKNACGQMSANGVEKTIIWFEDAESFELKSAEGENQLIWHQ